MKHRHIYLIITGVIIIFIPVIYFASTRINITEPSFQVKDDNQWPNEVIAYGESKDAGLYRVYKYDPQNGLKKELLSFQVPSSHTQLLASYREGTETQFYLNWTNDYGKDFEVDVIDETAESTEASGFYGENSILKSLNKSNFGKYTFVRVYEPDVWDGPIIGLDLIDNDTDERSVLLREAGVRFITFATTTNEIVFSSSQYLTEAANIADIEGSRRALFKGAFEGEQTAIKYFNFSRDNKKVAFIVNTFSGYSFLGATLRIIDFENLSVIDEFPLARNWPSGGPSFFGWFYAE